MAAPATAPTILSDLTYEPDFDRLVRKLRVSREAQLAELRALADAAAQIARPKAMFRLGFIDARTEDSVTIEGVTFTSRLLVGNINDISRVFAYTATAGRELEAWGKSLDDMLQQYFAEAIQEQALHAAGKVFRGVLKDQYKVEKISSMNPGSLESWPIEEQRPLFELLGDTEEAIGVRLLESLLMSPGKSVSGILFESEKQFYNCQLCPRPDCPNRRAAYQDEFS